MKKRIAIWMFGGIGTGSFSQGQPLLEKLILELSKDFEIVIYSRSLINEDYVPEGFTLRYGPKKIKNQSIRWLVLYKYFVADHLRKKFSLVCTFWGFPGGFLATLIAKVFRLPGIVSLQGGDTVGIASLNYGIMHRSVFRRLALWTYRSTEVLIALTNFQKKLIIGYGLSRPILVIPYGVDPAVFGSSVKKEKPGEPHRFIHVSNYNPIKDLETLLRAFALIHEKQPASLRIVGDEYSKSNGKSLCVELGIERRVEFCGSVAYAQMPEYYAWADTMLHTSLYEGQGIVIAEAAMSGVLIAGTSVGLASDLGETAAVLVSPGEYHLLAEKVLEVINNTLVADEKKKNALTWAIQNDFHSTVNKFKSLFNEYG